VSAMTVGILGGGRWGFALARAAQMAGNRAVVCTRRDTADRPEGVEVTGEVHVLGARATLIILAVPSNVARPVATTLGDSTTGAHYVVHAVRGLSSEGLLPISAVVRQETPVKRVGALAGPVLAHDLLEGRPSVIAVASHYPEVIESVKSAIASPSLRVSASDDIVGTEWASALVGAMLVGVGFARELGISEPLISGLMVRALREAASMGVAAGGLEKTFYGLAGIGDLMAAMAQQDARPEVAFGQRVAKGARSAQLAAEMGVRIEPIDLVPRLVTFARQRGLKTPVFETLAAVIEGRGDIQEITASLMRS
jgi:glycerol-3-phosphate dehydrogenase (NAD(P)+)